MPLALLIYATSFSWYILLLLMHFTYRNLFLDFFFKVYVRMIVYLIIYCLVVICEGCLFIPSALMIFIHQLLPWFDDCDQGMGEPLNNYNAVVEAVRVMLKQPFQLSPKRITISTVSTEKSYLETFVKQRKIYVEYGRNHSDYGICQFEKREVMNFKPLTLHFAGSETSLILWFSCLH